MDASIKGGVTSAVTIDATFVANGAWARGLDGRRDRRDRRRPVPAVHAARARWRRPTSPRMTRRHGEPGDRLDDRPARPLGDGTTALLERHGLGRRHRAVSADGHHRPAPSDCHRGRRGRPCGSAIRRPRRSAPGASRATSSPPRSLDVRRLPHHAVAADARDPEHATASRRAGRSGDVTVYQGQLSARLLPKRRSAEWDRAIANRKKCRLELTDGDWLLVRKHLTAGEERDAQARVIKAGSVQARANGPSSTSSISASPRR